MLAGKRLEIALNDQAADITLAGPEKSVAAFADDGARRVYQ